MPLRALENTCVWTSAAGVCGLTVNAELDLPAGVAHGAGGGADVEACVLGRGPREVEVAAGVRLQEGAVSGERLASLGGEEGNLSI